MGSHQNLPELWQENKLMVEIRVSESVGDTSGATETVSQPAPKVPGNEWGFRVQKSLMRVLIFLMAANEIIKIPWGYL